MVVVVGHAGLFKDVHIPTHAGFANGFARIVVPFFMIVSGYFFDAAMRDGPSIWAAGVLRLYMFWTAVFLPLVVLIGDFSFIKLGFYILTGYAHLWYLPALLGAGLMLWLVRDWNSTRIFRIALGLFLIGFTIQYVLNFLVGFEQLTHRNGWIVLLRNFAFFGFPYMALGYLLRRGTALDQFRSPALLGLLALGVMIMAGEVWLNYHFLILGGYFDLIGGAFLVTPVLFLLLTRVRGIPEGRWLAPLSAAIYFIHPIFVYPLEHWMQIEPMLRAPISLVASICASYLLLRFNKLVPVI
jgi:surface polysaccharide O-acyltransferase-like enzyme